MKTLSFKTSAKITSLLALALLLSAAPMVVSANSGNNTLAASLLSPATKVKCPDCWAGYGVTGTGITSVSTTLTAPAIKCSASQGVQGVGLLVAIDGSSATDFALAGLVAECSGSTLAVYNAQWFNAGTDSGAQSSWSVKAGDTITMSVVASGANFKFTVKDGKHSLTGTASDSGAAKNYGTCFTDMLTGDPLVNFKSVSFSNCLVNKTGVGKTTQTLVEWICYNSGSTSVLAKPSALSGTKLDDFNVAWKAYGP
jgi:hypothetical protein